MSVAADLDAPHAARSDAFSDSLTVSFGDASSEVYGTLRLGLSAGSAASGLAMIFDRSEVAAVAAENAVPVDDGASWDSIGAAGLDVETIEPLRRWRVAFAGDGASLDLELEALGEAFALEDSDAVAKLGGMSGFDQPLRVTGSAQLPGRRAEIDGLGQRGRSWGEPDWERIGRTRTLGAWFPDDRAGGDLDRPGRLQRSRPRGAQRRRVRARRRGAPRRARRRTRGCRRHSTTTGASAAPGSSCG